MEYFDFSKFSSVVVESILIVFFLAALFEIIGSSVCRERWKNAVLYFIRFASVTKVFMAGGCAFKSASWVIFQKITGLTGKAGLTFCFPPMHTEMS